MNLWHDLDIGAEAPERILVIVEIPSDTRNKYEFDHELGIIRLNRVLASSLHYPADYGLIPQTLYEDGDPLDVVVMIKEPTFPGCIVIARPIGLFRMRDQGVSDDKVLAVVDNDPLFRNYRHLDDVATSFKNELAHFFSHYKDLEEKRVEARGWENRDAALTAISDAHKAYLEQFSGKSID